QTAIATLPEHSFFFSRSRRHTRCLSDWSSDVCSSDLRSPAHAAGGACRATSDRPRVSLHPPRIFRSPCTAVLRRGRFSLTCPERSEERRVGKDSRALWWPDE